MDTMALYLRDMNDHQRATNRPKASNSSTNHARGSRPGPRGSIKPLDVRAGVVARHAQGETKTAIARTYGIDRGTVARILSSAEIQQQVDSVRSDIAQSGDIGLENKLKGQNDLSIISKAGGDLGDKVATRLCKTICAHVR